MYMKLKIFSNINSLQILEQVGFPFGADIIYSDGVTIRTCDCPELNFYSDGDIIFYLRGRSSEKDLKLLGYQNIKSLYRILKALATVASVDIIWS